MKNMRISTLQKLHDDMQRKVNKELERFTRKTGIIIGNIGLQYDVEENGRVVYTCDIHPEIELLFDVVDEGRVDETNSNG